MTHELHQFTGFTEARSRDAVVSTRATWRQEGPYIVDATGKKVALMQGEPAEHGWHQRRILAAINAMQDTPTQFIEEMLEECEDNLILTLITRDRKMASTLEMMEQKIAAHCREIEHLRDLMDACRVFEEQRLLLNQAPGAAEYEGLLRTLGMR